MNRATLCLGMLLCIPGAQAYSVLSHEAIIDSAWEQNIKPLLLDRFPHSTPDELKHAHAYTYAGCILQDMGYYPFGSKFFSDLVHYVRSGDFVINLIRESQDLNEYAFALGALAHYAADTSGHSIAVNRTVPLEYPKLRRQFGESVTYEDDPTRHIKVEFSFDVLQVASGRYAPQAYHDFIGFEVSRPVLERAFRATYGIELKDVFGDLDLAIGTYRRAVSVIIPKMTRIAWKLKKDELAKAQPRVDRRDFIYDLSKASYHKEWDGSYREPGFGTKVLTFIIGILPKVGPLKALAFRPLTPEGAKLFQESFSKTLDSYQSLLAQHKSRSLRLVNRNLDTGSLVRPAEYHLTDNSYSKLAIKLAERDSGDVDAELRQEVVGYFDNTELPFSMKKDRKTWAKTMDAVTKLRTTAAATR